MPGIDMKETSCKEDIYRRIIQNKVKKEDDIISCLK